MDFAEFVRRAEEAHSGAFTYPSQAWTGVTGRVLVLCASHGEFLQRADKHLQAKCGCPKCGHTAGSGQLRLSQVSFMSRAVEIHGDTYDLSKADYTGMKDKIIVGCRTHGDFYPSAGNFISRKSGCPACGRARTGEVSRLSEGGWIAKFRSTHGNTYEYAGVIYEDAKAYARVICAVHGGFQQLASDHARGIGCYRCSHPVQDQVSFIAAATEVHGTAYNYGRVVYTSAIAKVEITCPTHGVFLQRPSDHVNGQQGCPTCGRVGPSQGQRDLHAFLSTHTEALLEHPFHGKRLDVFLPRFGIGVEYHGLIWHSERFAADKLHLARRHSLAALHGVRLIHIFADEWAHARHKVEAILLSAMGGSSKRFARCCAVSEVPGDEAEAFLDLHHIQGSVRGACTHFGLSCAGQLVAVMSFSRVISERGSPASVGQWELRRYASSGTVVGGASKLFRAFLRSQTVSRVVSYSDNRMFSGGLYKKLGFVSAGQSRPDYTYVTPASKHREHKSHFQRSRLLDRFGGGFDPTLSESVNCNKNGWYRIFDCGKTKWVWRP